MSSSAQYNFINFEIYIWGNLALAPEAKEKGNNDRTRNQRSLEFTGSYIRAGRDLRGHINRISTPAHPPPLFTYEYLDPKKLSNLLKAVGNKWQSQDLNPGPLSPNPVHYTTLLLIKAVLKDHRLRDGKAFRGHLLQFLFLLLSNHLLVKT